MENNQEGLPQKYSLLPPIGATKSILSNVRNLNIFKAAKITETSVRPNTGLYQGRDKDAYVVDDNMNNSNKKTPESPRKPTTGESVGTPERRLHTGARAERARKKRQLGKISRISPLARFRTAVKTVISKQIRSRGQEPTTTVDTVKEYLSFDKNYFKVSTNRKGLTVKEKNVLNMDPFERSEDDLFTLRGVVGRLKAFEKYTPKVKHDLSRVVSYMALNKGRYIIKQGHDGFSFYFIISGKVQVRLNETDPDTGLTREFAVAEMGDGAAFGELALMHNIKRTATIVCIADGSEFLRVERHDFEKVLQNAIIKEWDARLNVLKGMPLLSDLDDEELNILNTDCRIEEYMPGQVLIGNTTEIQNTFYFIAQGQCDMVKKVDIVKEQQQFGKMKVHLLEDLPEHLVNMLPKTDLKKRRHGAHKFFQPEQQLWSIGVIGRGFYFGFGEDLSNTYVIAKTKVDVLQIRRIKFVKQGRWRYIQPMRTELDKSFPTNNLLLKKYIAESKWDFYKQRVVGHVIGRRRVQCPTQWDDVPVSLRYNNVRCGNLQVCFKTRF